MGSVARYVETVVVSPYAVLTRISRVASSSPSAPPQRHAVFVGTREFYIGTITALPRAGKLLQSDGGMRAYFNQHDEIVVVDAAYCYQVTFDSEEPDAPPSVLWVGGAGIFAAEALPSGARSDGEGEGGADESGAIARGYTRVLLKRGVAASTNVRRYVDVSCVSVLSLLPILRLLICCVFRFAFHYTVLAPFRSGRRAGAHAARRLRDGRATRCSSPRAPYPAKAVSKHGPCSLLLFASLFFCLLTCPSVCASVEVVLSGGAGSWR